MGIGSCVTDPYSIMNIAVRPASMLEEPTTEPPVINIPAGSIAQNKPVYASSTEPGLGNTPEKAVDGNIATRWSSDYSDNQYIYVDLLDEYELKECILSGRLHTPVSTKSRCPMTPSHGPMYTPSTTETEI